MMILVLLLTGCQPNSKKSAQPIQNTDNSTSQTTDFDSHVKGKYWQLIKLNGQEIVVSANQQRKIHIKISGVGNRIDGFAGCNNFFGTYELAEDKLRIKFSQMATTMMACPDEDIDEHAFLEVLNLTDNYHIFKDNNHNDMLALNVGRRAPLAVFKAVYLE